jgi:TRAP transporter TAXI family solute receptor
MVSKKGLSIVVMLFLVITARPTLAADAIINVLTGGGNSAYYPLGTALGNVIGKSMPGVKTLVQTTKGSVENLNMMEAGRGEVAFALGDSLSDAWKGSEDAGFKAPLRKLRGIAAIYPNHIQIVARADSRHRALADRRDRRVRRSVDRPIHRPQDRGQETIVLRGHQVSAGRTSMVARILLSATRHCVLTAGPSLGSDDVIRCV